jgi:hypothetical protein
MTTCDLKSWANGMRKKTLHVLEISPNQPFTMGRKSKASLAHLANLSKAPVKRYKATVEDVPDSDMHLDFMPGGDAAEEDDVIEDQGFDDIGERLDLLEDDFSDDGDVDSDMESVCDSEFEDLQWDEDDEAEIKDEATLLTFVDVLRQAQATAEKAEQKKWGERKRPRCYSKNSV